MQLQEELTTTENQISFSRQHYNATVLDFNNTIQTFPAVLIAGMLGFMKREFFDAEPEAAEVPKVDLSLARTPPAGHGPVPASALTAHAMATSTFYSQIGANKRNSILLACRRAPARRARAGDRLGGHRRPAGGAPVARHRDRHRPRRVAVLVLRR